MLWTGWTWAALILVSLWSGTRSRMSHFPSADLITPALYLAGFLPKTLVLNRFREAASRGAPRARLMFWSGLACWVSYAFAPLFWARFDLDQSRVLNQSDAVVMVCMMTNTYPIERFLRSSDLTGIKPIEQGRAD